MACLGRGSAVAGVVGWTLVSFASPARAEPACVATCDGARSAEEARKVAAVVEPTLQTIRSCLARSGGGDAVRPTVLATMEGAGAARTVRVVQFGAGGREKLACMPKISSVQSGAGATEMMLCELRCDGPPLGAALAPAPTDDKDWPAPTPAPKPQTQELWYGWQTLIVDGTALGLMIGGTAVSARSGGGIAGLGYLTFLLGPPIVHFAHRRVGAGFGSLGMRLLAPIGFGLLGGLAGILVEPDSLSHGSSGDGVEAGLAIGLLVGWGASVAIDAALLSYEKVEVAPPKNAQAIRVLPSLVLAPTPRGGFLGTGGLTGTF